MEELRLALDHITLNVEELSSAKAFYQPALAALGLEVVGELAADVTGDVACIGFGIGRKGSFWVVERGRQTPPAHICFRARSRAAVRAFHSAALASGGRDHGEPGPRPLYHEAYYAAFVLDPEEHNIEAVCFEPERS